MQYCTKLNCVEIRLMRLITSVVKCSCAALGRLLISPVAVPRTSTMYWWFPHESGNLNPSRCGRKVVAVPSENRRLHLSNPCKKNATQKTLGNQFARVGSRSTHVQVFCSFSRTDENRRDNHSLKTFFFRVFEAELDLYRVAMTRSV